MKRFVHGNWRNLNKICTRSWNPGAATSTSSANSAKALYILKSSQASYFGTRSNTFTRHPMHKSMLFMAFGSAFYIASMGLSNQASSEAAPEDSSDIHAAKVPVSHPEEHTDPEKIMKQVEAGIQERLKSLKLSASSLSPYTVSAKGQQVSVKIPISPLCDLWSLVVDVVARIGKLNGGIEGEKMLVSASESVVAQVLTLESKDRYKSFAGDAPLSNSLSIGVFEPLIGEKFPEIEFLKNGYYSEEELDIVVSTLKLASSEKVRSTPRQHYKKQYERKSKSSNSKSLLDVLESMGVKVYANGSQEGQLDTEVISWDNIAGYHDQKREIEDTVLLALRCPEVYDSIARGTRRKFESNRPRAVLFEGPPGTGKTSSARVIANQAGVPLLYVPLEAIMSKYYGESERALGKVFNTANDLENGAIIFLDEIDSLAMTRDSEMHEATRRTLSVLLRQIDGFEQDKRVVVIAATNRKEDLDPALISRFDSSITFGLPDQKTREEITSQYACHLKPDELAAVAAVSEGMSGRDLRDICQQAERRWASKVIRNQKGSPLSHGLPPLEEYIYCAEKRRNAMEAYHKEQRGRSPQRIHPSPGPPSVVV